MADRKFPIEAIERAGQRIPTAVIECGKCGAKDFFNHPHGHAPEHVVQSFRNRGWFVGNGPARDVCLECQKEKKQMTKKPAIQAVEAALESPRKMSRDDRVVIIAKIQDVHDGDRYSAGWSDKKVGEDLGVPWAWVKDIRENALDFKGGHDGALDEFMSQARPVLDEARVFLAQAQEMAARIGKIEALAKKIEGEIGR